MLPDVVRGGEHVSAHNDERHLINGLQDVTDPDFVKALKAGYVGVITPQMFGALANGSANDTAAIDLAIAALVPGSTLYFPPGRYMTNGGHIIDTPSVKIVGSSGRAQTYNSSAQLYLRNGANSDMLTITNNQITIRDLVLHGQYAGQTAPSRGLVIETGSNYLLVDAVWVSSFNGDGIVVGETTGTGTLSSTFNNCESRMNQGYGLVINGTGTDSMFTNMYIDQNTASGIYCGIGGDYSFTSCHIWGNGTDNANTYKDGVTIIGGKSIRFSNCYIESNTNGAGVGARSSNSADIIIQGCDIWNNGFQGITLFQTTHSVINGNVIRRNNFKSQVGPNGSGISLSSCSAITIMGNVMLKETTGKQTYGYYEGSSCSDIKFQGNISRGIDHDTAGVFLGPGTQADLGGYDRIKLANQSVSDTTLVDDTELQFPVAVGEVWVIEGVVFADGTQAADISLRLSGPSGSTGLWRAMGPSTSTTSTTAASFIPTPQNVNSSVGVGLIGAGIGAPIEIKGTMTVTTAGMATIKFAQLTTDATAVILRAGSYLKAKRINA